jgi:hypothetical protein
MVSKTKLDLPEPETPVNTVIWVLGMSRDKFVRLFSRAPRITMEFRSVMKSAFSSVCFVLIPAPNPNGAHPWRGVNFAVASAYLEPFWFRVVTPLDFLLEFRTRSLQDEFQTKQTQIQPICADVHQHPA